MAETIRCVVKVSLRDFYEIWEKVFSCSTKSDAYRILSCSPAERFCPLQIKALCTAITAGAKIPPLCPSGAFKDDIVLVYTLTSELKNEYAWFGPTTQGFFGATQGRGIVDYKFTRRLRVHGDVETPDWLRQAEVSGPTQAGSYFLFHYEDFRNSSSVACLTEQVGTVRSVRHWSRGLVDSNFEWLERNPPKGMEAMTSPRYSRIFLEQSGGRVTL